MRAGLKRTVFSTVALLAVIIINFLANGLPFNGKRTAQIAEQYPVLIQPAGYAFGIWIVIYLGMISFIVYQALPSQRDNVRLERITPTFMLSCIVNVVWVLTWHYGYLWLNLFVIHLLLATVAGIYLQLRGDRKPISLYERCFLWAPFSIYSGWVVVTTIVNLAIALYATGWQATNTFGIVLSVLLCLSIAAIGIRVLFYSHDPVFALVIIWALVAIAIHNTNFTLMAATAVAGAIVVFGVMIYLFVTLGNRKRQLLNYSYQ